MAMSSSRISGESGGDSSLLQLPCSSQREAAPALTTARATLALIPTLVILRVGSVRAFSRNLQRKSGGLCEAHGPTAAWEWCFLTALWRAACGAGASRAATLHIHACHLSDWLGPVGSRNARDTSEAATEVVHQPDLVTFAGRTTHGALPWRGAEERRAVCYRAAP